MGTSSARPDDLDAFASGSRDADAALRELRGRLQGALDEFRAGTRWGSLDAESMMAAFGSYIWANDDDANWTAQIATTFRRAGRDGMLALPDAAIEASLRSAHLDHDRLPLNYADPVAFGAPPTSGYADDPVNTAIGNFVERETDLICTGLPAGLTVVRTYNSRSDRDGPFGPRWSSRLVARPDGAAFEGPDGQRALFPRAGEGFGRIDGVGALVERTPSGLVLAWFGGDRWTFDAAGRIELVSRGPGTEVRFGYDERGRLVELAHVRGRRVTVRWDGDRIVGLSSSDGREARYRYEHGILVEAEGVAGTRRYGIDSAGLIASVTDADGVVELVNTYDEHGRVLTQRSPFGRQTIFAYLPGNVTVTSDDSGGPLNTYLHDRAGRLVGAVDGHDQTLRKSYDDWGNPVAIIDRAGAVTVQEWDDRSRLVRRTLPAGSSIAYSYDDADRVLSVSASTGGETRYRYRPDERSPVEIVDAEGGVSRLTVADGLVHDLTDPDGIVLRFRYDGDGNLVAAIDGDGAEATIERDPAGNAVTAVTPSGRRTTFRYDHRGMLVERTTPDGAIWRHEYSPVGRPVATIAPDGARTETRYGDHGAAEEIVDPLGGVTARRYDTFGNLVGITAPDGAKWTYAHDALSRLSALTDPAGATWLREYDVEGRLTASIDPTGIRYSATLDVSGQVTALNDGLTSSTFEFDALGRTLAHIRPDGSALRATYDRCGRRVTVTDPEGGVTHYTYTPGGRVQEVLTPAGRTESYTYDRCGRPVTRVDGAGHTWTQRYSLDGAVVERISPTGEAETLTYDTAGRLATRTVPGAGTTTWSYDPVGRVAAVTGGPAGRREFGYDAAGRLVQATNALGGVTHYGYNSRGWLVRTTDPLGGISTRRYDEVGRLVTETDPLQRTTTFAYDAAGHLIRRVDATGAAVVWTYDMSGRVRSVRGGGTDAVVSIERDVLGRPIVVGEPGKPQQELRRDRSGRLVERRRGDLALRWGYDADGHRTELGYPDGSRCDYERDGTGRTVAVEHPLLGRVRMDRDAAGRLVGVHGDGHDATWEFADGALVGYANGPVRTRLTRDETGRVVEAESGGQVHRYAYDAAGQLVASDGRTFSYDAAGRLVRDAEREFTYDAAGQLVTAGQYRFGYDAAGRRTVESGPDGERTYRWDWMGRLSGITTSGPSGTRSTEVYVDALGELAAVDGVGLMWDTADPLAGLRWIGQSAVIGAGSPLATVNAAQRAAGEDPWLATDWHGTVGDTLDPWGTAGTEPSLGHRGELGFDGLVWLRNRVYDPATRGFLTPDPLPAVPGTAYAANPYHYAGNDPVGQVDPLGLRPMTDAQMQAYRDQLGHGAWGDVTDWWSNNWEYVAAAATVTAGVALMFTGVGGPVGLALIAGASGAMISGGVSIASQKYANGDVNWGQVGNDSLIGGAFGLAGGAAGWGIAKYGGQALRALNPGATRDALLLERGAAASSAPLGAAEHETFYRGMSWSEHESLTVTGGLSPRGEAFVTQDRAYIEQLAGRWPDKYETIVEFRMEPGTRAALLQRGARSPGDLVEGLHPDLSMIEKGQLNAVHIKGEWDSVNYGLRSGSVDVFNTRIRGFTP